MGRGCIFGRDTLLASDFGERFDKVKSPSERMRSFLEWPIRRRYGSMSPVTGKDAGRSDRITSAERLSLEPLRITQR